MCCNLCWSVSIITVLSVVYVGPLHTSTLLNKYYTEEEHQGVSTIQKPFNSKSTVQRYSWATKQKLSKFFPVTSKKMFFKKECLVTERGKKILMRCGVVVISTACSAQVQILLTACRRFAMVRISDNGLGWK